MKEASQDKNTRSRKPGLAPAFYVGKERWKSKPGNRYTAEELDAMERNWEIRVTKPVASHSRPAD